jgi:CheY-like chemotaxis protein
MNELALIIEDEEDLGEIFSSALRGVGFEVELADNGQKAQERLKNGTPPYLILLDMHLPHVSGGEILTRIIKQDKRFEKTLIIITTADARMGEAYQDEVDFVLIKPISFVQLRDLTARLKPQH